MNIVNVIIVGFILLALAVIIFVIIKSLKSADEIIIKELKTKKIIKQKSFWQKIKTGVMAVFETVVKQIHRGVQKLHSWVVKNKKREEDDVIKAKEELVIDSDLDQVDVTISDKKDKKSKAVVFNQTKNKEKKVNKFVKNYFDKSIDGSKVSSQDDKVTEQAVSENVDIKGVKKKGLVKNLFKIKKKRQKEVDRPDANNWSLKEGSAPVDNSVIQGKKTVKANIDIKPVGEKFKGASTSTKVGGSDGDDAIGVDRGILEKKILQKIDKDPKNIDNYKELGDLYIKMDKLSDAEEVFDYVLSVNPRDLVALKKKNKVKLLKRLRK